MKTNSDRFHVLVVSCEPRILAEIKMELMEQFEVSIAASSDAVLFVLREIQTAAILFYIGEQKEEAFVIYESVGEAIRRSHIPILFLAERGNDADEIKAFQLGAVDYTVRRKGTIDALNSRINLRIHASLHHKPFDELTDTDDLVDLLTEKRILVVDDVKLNRDMIESMLADIQGLHLEFAENGQQAYDIYIEEPDRFDMIIMDIQMPIMKGDEATQRIRSYPHPKSRLIPIIALTADIGDIECARFFTSGMNDYIPKPMDYAQLLNMVTEYCY